MGEAAKVAQRVAAIVVRKRELRVYGDRRIDATERVFETSEILEGDAAVDLRQRIAGLERSGQPELPFGRFVLVPGEKDGAQRIGGAEVPGVLSQDRAIELLRVRDLAAIVKSERSLVLRVGIGNLTGDEHRRGGQRFGPR
jgi:hypothetical protein